MRLVLAPSTQENTPILQKLIVKFGFNLEFVSKVHEGVFWIPKCLDLSPQYKPTLKGWPIAKPIHRDLYVRCKFCTWFGG